VRSRFTRNPTAASSNRPTQKSPGLRWCTKTETFRGFTIHDADTGLFCATRIGWFGSHKYLLFPQKRRQVKGYSLEPVTATQSAKRKALRSPMGLLASVEVVASWVLVCRTIGTATEEHPDRGGGAGVLGASQLEGRTGGRAAVTTANTLRRQKSFPDTEFFRAARLDHRPIVLNWIRDQTHVRIPNPVSQA
jgi:hypothetical protein